MLDFVVLVLTMTQKDNTPRIQIVLFASFGQMTKMKKVLSIVFAAFCIGTTANAAPGDTTWVQANDVQLNYYNNFDTTVTFPAAGTSYRKVLMIFTLGKYSCPGSPTYCGDWDYTVQNFVMTPTDTFELGRLITPYANSGAPRTPLTWQQHYIFDITDYATKLHGSAVMRILYSGYSGGFTGNIKFAFIEGTPERNVIDIKRPWYGSFGFGGTTSINTHFPAVTETAPTGTVSAEMKFTVTGHGSDGSGCSEFCSKNYDLLVNGSTIATETMWRNTCGINELYPQSGTWVYDRGNWCPGAIVYSHRNVLTGITAGTNYNTAIQFESYSGSGSASYTTEAALIYYGPINRTIDASLDDVIAPNKDENHFRENPNCGKPVIHVRNSGSTAITAMDINYKIAGGATHTYSWTGSLASLTEADITLPQMVELGDQAGVTSGVNTFTAKIATVNGAVDNDTTNNLFSCQYVNAPLFPNSFRYIMHTNNAAVGGVSETSWKVYDMTGAVVASRTNAAINTTYTDTLNLPDAVYKLVITDLGCDGLYWWANSAAGNGSFYARKLTSSVTIPMSGYNYTGQYAHDFGCEYVLYFKTSNSPAGVDELSENTTNISLFPNPAQNNVTIEIAGITNVNGTIRVIDAMGREVMMENCTSAQMQINTTNLANGAYTIQYIDKINPANKLQSRVVIAK